MPEICERATPRSYRGRCKCTALRPAARAPSTSSISLSPTWSTCCGSTRRRVQASAKILGSGFSYPASNEEIITSKCASSPSARQRLCNPACQFEMTMSRSPRARTARRVSSTSGNTEKCAGPMMSHSDSACSAASCDADRRPIRWRSAVVIRARNKGSTSEKLSGIRSSAHSANAPSITDGDHASQGQPCRPKYSRICAPRPRSSW